MKNRLLALFAEDRWYSEVELASGGSLPTINSYQLQKMKGILQFLVEQGEIVKIEREGDWYYQKPISR